MCSLGTSGGHGRFAEERKMIDSRVLGMGDILSKVDNGEYR